MRIAQIFFCKFLSFLKECTLWLHSPPKMSGAQSALFSFEMSGAHALLRFWECTHEWPGCYLLTQKFVPFWSLYIKEIINWYTIWLVSQDIIELKIRVQSTLVDQNGLIKYISGVSGSWFCSNLMDPSGSKNQII